MSACTLILGACYREGTLGRAEEGAGLGDERVCRELQEGHHTGTDGGAERDDDSKG